MCVSHCFVHCCVIFIFLIFFGTGFSVETRRRASGSGSIARLLSVGLPVWGTPNGRIALSCFGKAQFYGAGCVLGRKSQKSRMGEGVIALQLASGCNYCPTWKDGITFGNSAIFPVIYLGRKPAEMAETIRTARQSWARSGGVRFLILPYPVSGCCSSRIMETTKCGETPDHGCWRSTRAL